jgi:HEAT repeat protein
VLLKGDPKGLQKRLSLVGASQSPSEILQSTEALKIWLEANPASIRTIPQTLLSTDLNDDVRSRIVYALQKVGGEKAEQALIDIAESDAHTDSTRRAAIGAFNFVRISPRTEQELWKMRAGERFSGDSEETRAVYREMATLALGGGARALLEESPERSATIVQKLSSELEGATQRRAVRDIETLIMALGNSSHEEATPLLIQYLDSTVDSVRGAVVTALQSSERELPLDTIIEKALKEENPNVRTQFVELLRKEPISPYSFASAVQLFVEEDDRSARLALAKYLARAGNEYPEQRHHIKLLLRSERDPLVAKALGTR